MSGRDSEIIQRLDHILLMRTLPLISQILRMTCRLPIPEFVSGTSFPFRRTETGQAVTLVEAAVDHRDRKAVNCPAS
jgi:hypothetical protein